MSKVKSTDKDSFIAISCKVIQNGTTVENSNVEYMGVPLGEVSLVGYCVSYNDDSTKIKIGLWDQTGFVEVLFYNKNESEVHSGLDGFVYEEKGLVKLIGKVKSYKNQILIDGIKIMQCSLNEFIYHKLEIVNDWLYLTSEEKGDVHSHKVNINNMTNNKAPNRDSDGSGMIKEKIKKILREHMGGTTVHEVNNTLKADENLLKRILREMTTEGFLFYDETSNEIHNI